MQKASVCLIDGSGGTVLGPHDVAFACKGFDGLLSDPAGCIDAGG